MAFFRLTWILARFTISHWITYTEIDLSPLDDEIKLKSPDNPIIDKQKEIHIYKAFPCLTDFSSKMISSLVRVLRLGKYYHHQSWVEEMAFICPSLSHWNLVKNPDELLGNLCLRQLFKVMLKTGLKPMARKLSRPGKLYLSKNQNPNLSTGKWFRWDVLNSENEWNIYFQFQFMILRPRW